MAKLDQKMKTLAFKLINDFGKSIKILSLNTDNKTVLPLLTKEVKSFISSYDQKDIDNQNIVKGDLKALIAYNASGDITLLKRIEIDSIKHKIININAIYSGDDICLYELQLRK